MPKKLASAVCFFIVISFSGWAQNFVLPPITNNIESIKNAFTTLIENTKNLGTVEYGSDWTSSPESITMHYIEYLDSVLANMTYDKVGSYIAEIRKNIDSMDRQAISRNAELDFERFLTAGVSDYGHEVSHAVDQHEGETFPATTTLNYDLSKIESLDNQVRAQKDLLAEYRSRLESIPSVETSKSRLDSIQDEMQKPENRRNSRRLEQLRTEKSNVELQFAQNNGARVSLTDSIRKIEAYLKEAENHRVRLVSESEERARGYYTQALYKSINNFHSWEAFFKKENTSVRDFLIIKKVKENMQNLLDEIPQRQVQMYSEKLEAFCREWGIP